MVHALFLRFSILLASQCGHVPYVTSVLRQEMVCLTPLSVVGRGWVGGLEVGDWIQVRVGVQVGVGGVRGVGGRGVQGGEIVFWMVV